jgi:hypothetical protein
VYFFSVEIKLKYAKEPVWKVKLRDFNPKKVVEFVEFQKELELLLQNEILLWLVVN